MKNTNESVTLSVVTGDHVPSFKNRKRAILDRHSGKMRTLTEPKVKKRMQLLENRIVSALYSLCQTSEHAMDLDRVKQLRTALSGLSDDSTKEIPEFSYGVQRVQSGMEGVIIYIDEIKQT